MAVTCRGTGRGARFVYKAMISHEPNPERAGMDRERIGSAIDIVDEGLARGLYTGAALFVSRRGVTAALCCVGHTDETMTRPVDEHTLFDLASLTKPMATAPSILMLAEDGKLDLRQPVSEFLPERDLKHLRDVSLFDLLTHTSGLPAWRDLHGGHGTREHALDILFGIRLDCPPGTRYEYSCLGYIMLGLVVEAVSGEGLDAFARGRIFGPLGMGETFFNPPASDNIASTGTCPRRGRIPKGVAHDLNAFTIGGISGNAGLFSSVLDTAMFCHSITLAGYCWGVSPLISGIKSRIFANALPESLGAHTCGGWYIWPNPLLPATESTTKATIGHSGFTGTAIIIDPQYELCSLLLTNRVFSPDDGSALGTLRRRVFGAVLGAIVW